MTRCRRHARADRPLAADLLMVVHSLVADLQTVACPTGVCSHPDPTDDRLPAADRNSAGLAVVGKVAAVGDVAVVAVAAATTASPSCSRPIDSSTTDAHDSGRPNTVQPKR